MVGLVVQFALGWLLVPEDFALFGMALSLTVFTSALVDGGVQKLLRQQPDRYAELVGPATVLALLFAAISAAILAALALASPSIFGTAGVRPIALVLAANVIVTAPVAVLRTRLQVDLRFRAASGIEAGLVVVRGGLTVAAAAAGFGALSFALPILVGTLLEGLLLLWRGAGRGFSLRGASARSVAAVLRTSRWIMLSAMFGAIVLRGDYLVLGIAAEPLLADYFFGFQLAASGMLLVTGGAYGVLLPAVARLAHDPARLVDALRRSVRLASFVVAPAAALGCLAAPALIHVAWGGKWDGSIVVAQAVAASILVRGPALVSAATVEATGRWRLRAALEAVEGATLVGAILAAIALAGEDLAIVAAVVGVQRILAGAMHLVASGAVAGVGWVPPLRWCAAFAMPAFVLLVLAEVAGRLAGHPADSITGGAVRLAVFLAGWLVVVGLLGRREVAEVRGGARR